MSVNPIIPDIRIDADEQSLPALGNGFEALSAERNIEAGIEIDDIDPDEEVDDRLPDRALQFGDEDDSPEYCHAALLTSPHIGATFAIADLNRDSSLGSPDDLTTLSMMLKIQSNSKGGDIDALKLHTKTLDAMFYRLTSMAATTDQLEVMEKLIKLALKAQNQSRAAILAISELNQPKIANVVKQANISGGHQQVNNGDVSYVQRANPDVGNKKPPNELS